DFAFNLTAQAIRADSQWRFDLQVPNARLQWSLGNDVIDAKADGMFVKDSVGFTGHLTVTGTNAIRPVDQLCVETFQLKFQRDKVWTVAGQMGLEILGRTCLLTAKYKGDDEDKRLTFTGKMSGDPVPLPGIDDASKAGLKELNFTLELARSDGRSGYSGFANGLLVGYAFGDDTTVQITLGPEFGLRADAKGLLLSDIAHALDLAIPDIVPKITGDYTIDVAGDATGRWRVHLAGELTAATAGGPAWNFAATPFATSASINLQRSIVDGKPVYSGCLDFVADGRVPLLDAVVFEHFALRFSQDALGAWTAHSNSRLNLFDQPVDAAIDYAQKKDNETLTFSVAGAPTLNLAAAHIKTKTITLTVTHEQGTSHWSLTAEGAHLRAGQWINVRGTLALGLHEKKQALILRPDKAQLAIDPPALQTGVVLALTHLRFEHTDKGWSVSGDVHTALTKLPDPVRSLLPKSLQRLADPERGLETIFAAGSDGISVTMTEFMEPIELNIKTPVRSPDGKRVQGADNEPIPDVDFGKAAVKASDFKLALDSDPSVSMKFGLALPSKLNHIFGTTDAGQPIHEVFEVYDEVNKNRASFVMFEASISTDSGISFAWADGLPFKTKNPDAVKDGRWTISLGADGEYGELTIDLPTLSYNGAAFEASGGCYLNKNNPPAIPLCLLQQLLILAGFKDIAASLPRKVAVPLELSLIEKDGDQWRLKDKGFRQLADHMENITGRELPQIRTALSRLSQADVVPMLPNGLCEYLDVRAPHGLTFKLAITPNGSVSFAVKTQGEPLRVLYPTGPLPISLQGVS
ncbi:MAG: hypothetical protein OEL91_09635, partial [Burkholderiaceae bacterium]|nr:hypothetical protein [Burkholderiaceae bacterium]